MRRYGGLTLDEIESCDEWLSTAAVSALVARVRELEGLLRESREACCRPKESCRMCPKIDAALAEEP